MSAETLATWLVLAAGVYAAAGLVFALAFVARGVERVDPAARGATLGFRLIVLPGVVALWPLLARRWWRGATAPPVEGNAHRRATRPASAR
ncbi:MAG TPA: hypothetical protein VGC00_10015 [Thermoanaerobaculia bacterium]|jgi:hypothetical protein